MSAKENRLILQVVLCETAEEDEKNSNPKGLYSSRGKGLLLNCKENE